ncbi:hypothetical protein BD779DRAFT_1683734 [Infundibulicybe gibba]|nr:hypothetical protein BD779DRAFT_1683734 [Infundibulicybe gibba]
MTEATEYIAKAILDNHHVSRASVADAGGISVATIGIKRGLGGPGGHLGTAGKDAGATIGCLLLPASMVSTEYVEDVSNTLEFASRASNHIAKENSKQWFTEYVNSISKLGWGKQAIKRREVSLSQVTTGTSFAGLIKNLVQADDSFDAAQKKVIGLTLDSLMKQQSRRALFNSFNSGGKDSTFAVTAATVKNGALAMRMAGFYFEANENVKDCFFFKINKTNIRIWIETTDVFANQKTIDANRKKIEDKLKGAAGDYIDDTPLD